MLQSTPLSTLLAMSQTEEQERTVADITEAEKVEFLQNIRIGLNRQEAAKALGYHGKHFRSLTSPKSPFYDEEFARTYGEAIGSLEHEQYRLERLREEGFRRAMTDSDRLLEKHLMVYDPNWAVLRQKDYSVNVTAIIEQRLKMLPTDLLERVLAALENDSDMPIEAAEYFELTAGDMETAA